MQVTPWQQYLFNQYKQMTQFLQKAKNIKNLQLNNKDDACIFLGKNPFTNQRSGKVTPKLQSFLIKLPEF